MIDLTPLEVRQKKGDFRARKALRGYGPALVDDFLDLVADRLEQLVKENLSLADRVERLEAQLGEYRERERALTEALVTAQELREASRRQAEKEAELLRREAELAAEKMMTAAALRKERAEAELRRIRARRAHLLEVYRGFLERELGELRVLVEELELEGAAGEDLAPTAAVGEQATLALEPAAPPSERGRRGRGRTAPAATPPAAPPAAEPPGIPSEETPVDGGGKTAPAEPDWLSSILKEGS